MIRAASRPLALARRMEMVVTERFVTHHGELSLYLPRTWPRERAAAAALDQRARTLAHLISGVPLEAFSKGAGRQVVLELVAGLGALWPVGAAQPIEVTTAIRIVRDGFGNAAG